MKTILVLTDFTAHSKAAAKFAMALAQHYNSNILLYNAYYIPNAITIDAGMYQPYYGDYEEFEKESLNKLKNLAEELRSLADFNPDIKIPEIEWMNDLGKIGDTIGDLLERRDIWMVVMGDKSHILMNNLFSGSDTDNVIRNVSCPVLVVPEKAIFTPFNRIALASSSFDQHDIYALNFIFDLIKNSDAKINIVHVPEHLADAHKESITRVPSPVFDNRVSYCVVTNGNIDEALIKFVQEEKCDLIVLVHKRYKFFEGLFHKSVIKSMIGTHLIPTLVFNY